MQFCRIADNDDLTFRAPFIDRVQCYPPHAFKSSLSTPDLQRTSWEFSGELLRHPPCTHVTTWEFIQTTREISTPKILFVVRFAQSDFKLEIESRTMKKKLTWRCCFVAALTKKPIALEDRLVFVNWHRECIYQTYADGLRRIRHRRSRFCVWLRKLLRKPAPSPMCWLLKVIITWIIEQLLGGGLL